MQRFRVFVIANEVHKLRERVQQLEGAGRRRSPLRAAPESLQRIVEVTEDLDYEI